MQPQPSPRPSGHILVNKEFFQGGITVDYKMGIANSFYYSYNLNFRIFPSQMTVEPGLQPLSTSLKDLILQIQQDLSGVRWGVGDQGWIYKIDAEDNVIPMVQMPENGSAGMLYSQITDQLYIPGQTAVSMYGRVTQNPNGPTFRPNQFDVSASYAGGTVNLLTASGWNGAARNNAQAVGSVNGITLDTYNSGPNQVTNTLTNTYTLPSTIVESTPTECGFSPDIEPFYSIAVYVDNVGTGDWTLTLHDSVNEELAAVTIKNADMVTGWNNFVFGKQIRAYVNASNVGYSAVYHFHLTSSVSGDTASVFTVNQGDEQGTNFLLFAYRLVQTNNGWHPTAYFTGGGKPLLCIGNGEYLSTYNFGNDQNPNNTQWQRHTLYFKPGYEVTGLSSNNQYLVIATGRTSTNGDRLPQQGCLYFWDGTTVAPSFTIDIPMGIPYGVYTFNNITYFACQGSLYAWTQGAPSVLKVRKLAYQSTDFMGTVDRTMVYPNAFTSRYTILYMGYPGYTTDPNLEYGIWSWGGVELTFPNSYGLSYTQSPNVNYFTTQNQRRLGCAVNYVDSLYSSWSYTDDNGVEHFGLDHMNNSSPPASTFGWESLIWDGGADYKQKIALRYKITTLPLPAGTAITPWVRKDRQAKIYCNTSATEGDTNVFFELNNMRFHELQWGFDGTYTGTALTPPTIIGVAVEIDPTILEGDLIPKEGG